MTGPKTNERPGTKAVLRHAQISPFKVRPVLDLIRGEHVQHALEILQFSERDAAIAVRKLLASAVANAANNDGLDPEELYVAACFADAGPNLRRFRYRARGRATRVLKRRSHITVIVSRLADHDLARYRERRAAEAAAQRSRRVEAGRRGRRRGADETPAEEAPADETPSEESPEAEATIAEAAEVTELATEPEDAQEEATEVAEDQAAEDQAAEDQADAPEEEEDS